MKTELISAFRIKDTKSGEYYQRSGSFGKFARSYPNIGQLRLSVLESFSLEDFKSKWKHLIIEEIETRAKEIMPFSKFYEESAFLREKNKEKEEKLGKKIRKEELEKELIGLNKIK